MAEVYRAKGYAGTTPTSDLGHRQAGTHEAHAAPHDRHASSHPLASAQRVSVNGVVIDPARIAREMQHHPSDEPMNAWTSAARALVIRELLLQEAHRLGIDALPVVGDDGRREAEDEAAIRALIAQEVATPNADPSECRRYYDKNRAKFRSEDIYEIRHILFAAAPSDTEARKAKRADAEAVIATLREGASSFAAMASAHSACPSAKAGGSLGQISKGQTVEEFETALAGLPVGEVAPEPIESRYGWHVVSVDRRINGAELPFEFVHERIAQWLKDRVSITATRQYISILVERAQIEGVTVTAADPSAH